MTPQTKILATALSGLTGLSLIQAFNAKLITIDTGADVILGVTNIFLLLFILALVVERACEGAMAMMTSVGLVPPEPAPGAPPNPQRRLVATLLCLLLATCFSGGGLRLAEMIMNAAAKSQIATDGIYGLIDIILTALILSGGSDGIHKIMTRLLPKDALPS